jgi:hypothetical protein
MDLPFLCSELVSTAIYGTNFKPKIFTDITMPDKQSYSPNTGKKSQVFNIIHFRAIVSIYRYCRSSLYPINISKTLWV